MVDPDGSSAPARDDSPSRHLRDPLPRPGADAPRPRTNGTGRSDARRRDAPRPRSISRPLEARGLESLEQLYLCELHERRAAEVQIAFLLPAVAEAAAHPDLAGLFERQRKVTRRQLRRLERIFDELGLESRRGHCRGIAELLADVRRHLAIESPALRDASLIGAMRRILHFEIAGYDMARTLAVKLGEYGAADRLETGLNEEGAAHLELTRIGERAILPELSTRRAPHA